ncbi:MAG: FtsX-like permease family protein [Sulfuritalea sp.]|nr:FtsX-like permease family protein [Sulfuritalea sp.]MDP1983920.1 FtsX-like permease family protein [Sulfuritalea sp.]
MNLLSLAWRNILRNRRRSALTLAAICVAATAILLLAGYLRATVRALETDTVRQVGHLQIMSTGYLQFGRGNPGRFAIRDHEAITAALLADPALRPMVTVITPILHVQGVAGHFATSTSSNFTGTGWDPDARALMLEWSGKGLRLPPGAPYLSAQTPNSGVIGVGLAQLLGLCEALQAKDCVSAPRPTVDPAAPRMSADLARLAGQSPAPESVAAAAPAIELLAAGAGGAPNVVRMEVLRAQRQGARELDAMYVGMPLSLAQRLVFGGGGSGASGIVIQLKDGADLEPARARVKAVLASRAKAMEVHDFHVVHPNFDQVVALFTAVFRFVTVLMAVVTLFSVANTINMAVGERIGEIGTLRAMGMKRGPVRRMFLIEGALLGAVGSGLGMALGIVLGEYAINASGMSWTPPGRSSPVPVGVDVLGSPEFMAGAVALFALLACVSSWWPARRAARLEIVEALRHV